MTYPGYPGDSILVFKCCLDYSKVFLSNIFNDFGRRSEQTYAGKIVQGV